MMLGNIRFLGSGSKKELLLIMALLGVAYGCSHNNDHGKYYILNISGLQCIKSSEKDNEKVICSLISLAIFR